MSWLRGASAHAQLTVQRRWAILCCSLVLSAWGHSDLPRFPRPCQIIWVWQYVGICWGPFRAFSDPPKPCEIISVLETIGLSAGLFRVFPDPPKPCAIVLVWQFLCCLVEVLQTHSDPPKPCQIICVSAVLCCWVVSELIC